MNYEYIYLDYAANTPVDKEVLDVFNDTTLKYLARKACGIDPLPDEEL